jgi:hypothetical protein
VLVQDRRAASKQPEHSLANVSSQYHHA